MPTGRSGTPSAGARDSTSRSQRSPCRTCHADHKGRNARITDWSSIGGRKRFDHDRTRFSLAGRHEKVACTKCHLRKLSSGRTSFVGLARDCRGCHGNVHEITSPDLVDACESCHPKHGGRADRMTASNLPFDHAKRTGTALDGKHQKARCVDCHEKARMSAKTKRSCGGCHKQPHGRSFRKSKCADCHAVRREFARSRFSHDETRFPLRGEHARPNCSRCHKSSRKKPKRTCSGCHKDPHRRRFAGTLCKSCHGLGGGSGKDFDHAGRTDFALTGKHAELSCRDCHRGKKPWRFEKQKADSCRGCHAHRDAHRGEFQEKQCVQCHREAGSTDLVFDHQRDSRFPLTGLHVGLDCKKCHEGSTFRTGKLDCAQCHEDSHQGQLGTECARCHQTDVKFPDLEFDHDRQTEFPLVGLHRTAPCEGCHVGRVYRIDRRECVDCHKDDDPHLSELGMKCETCHEPVKGASKFVHEAPLAEFALTGMHLNTECSYCHVVATPEEPPPTVGWTKRVPAPEMDRRFPVRGGACADCHFDVHDGAYGRSCDSCHDTESFAGVNAAVHDTGAFRLLGTHDNLACARCHEPQRPLAGLGTFCVGCHRTDDVHVNSLGPFCGQCHAQFDWVPARFNHAEVGFALVGMHRVARCRDCHGIGVYAGTPRDCVACHLGDYQSPTTTPNHSMAGISTDCQSCHRPVTWRGARYVHRTFVPRGAHATAGCRTCHVGGDYTAAFGGLVTAFECAGCHGGGGPVDRWPPDHETAGYPRTCELCHQEIAWTPAKLPR